MNAKKDNIKDEVIEKKTRGRPPIKKNIKTKELVHEDSSICEIVFTDINILKKIFSLMNRYHCEDIIFYIFKNKFIIYSEDYNFKVKIFFSYPVHKNNIKDKDPIIFVIKREKFFNIFYNLNKNFSQINFFLKEESMKSSISVFIHYDIYKISKIFTIFYDKLSSPESFNKNLILLNNIDVKNYDFYIKTNLKIFKEIFLHAQEEMKIKNLKKNEIHFHSKFTIDIQYDCNVIFDEFVLNKKDETDFCNINPNLVKSLFSINLNKTTEIYFRKDLVIFDISYSDKIKIQVIIDNL